jgi:hypothetical protein
MGFWVSGRDAVSGEPGRLLSDAATADAAREQARAQGLTPETVEPAEPAPEPRAAGRRGEAVPGWFWIGAGVALLGSCAWSAALTEVYRWLGRGDFAGVAVVALYLAVPAGLIGAGVRRLRPPRDRT